MDRRPPGGRCQFSGPPSELSRLIHTSLWEQREGTVWSKERKAQILGQNVPWQNSLLSKWNSAFSKHRNWQRFIWRVHCMLLHRNDVSVCSFYLRLLFQIPWTDIKYCRFRAGMLVRCPVEPLQSCWTAYFSVGMCLPWNISPLSLWACHPEKLSITVYPSQPEGPAENWIFSLTEPNNPHPTDFSTPS